MSDLYAEWAVLLIRLIWVMSRENMSTEFSNRFYTNQAVKQHKMDRGLEFLIHGLY